MNLYVLLRNLIEICGGLREVNADTARLYNDLCWGLAEKYHQNMAEVRRIARVAQG